MPMKEQVTDISKVLKSMAEEMLSMRKTIDQQYSENTWVRDAGSIQRTP